MGEAGLERGWVGKLAVEHKPRIGLVDFERVIEALESISAVRSWAATIHPPP
jgi:hypothetical protein